jgi:hypothetical protein
MPPLSSTSAKTAPIPAVVYETPKGTYVRNDDEYETDDDADKNVERNVEEYGK